MLMSVSGFDRELTDFSDGRNLTLVGPDELFGNAPAPPVR